MSADATTRAVLVEPATTAPFHRYAGAFLAGFASAETRKAYRADLTRWAEFCAAYQLDPLTARRTHVDLYLRQLEGQGLAKNSRARRLCTLKSFYGWMVDEELVESNPAARVKTPTRDLPELPALNRHEAHRFVTAAEQDPDPFCPPTLLLMLLAGMRVNEVCTREIGDLRVDRWVGILDVRGKGDKRRQVELPPRVMAALDVANRDRTDGPLLLNRAGRRLTRSNVHDQIRRVAKRAGVRGDLSPHCLRRSYIQIALDAGAPIRDVQKVVGHSDPSTTARYDRRELALGRSPAYAVQAAVA